MNEREQTRTNDTTTDEERKYHLTRLEAQILKLASLSERSKAARSVTTARPKPSLTSR